MQTSSGLKIRSMEEDSSAEPGVYTTSNGVPVQHAYESQRVGHEGPLLLQDFHLIDLLSHFDRERIPERVVHAKGGGAHGVYRTTHPIPDLCMANIFASKAECPITARFSTVGGESGSPDCARDPRGFSVKFRTDQGNMDWVFNNTPIFFLRDPAKFPHFIHTQKRNPQTNLTHADDSTAFWDYMGNNPESVHQFLYLMGPRGIPATWRHMQGYSGHTFKFVNEQGKWKYVQIHILSQQGTKNLTDDEAGEQSADAHQKDLFEAIERGEFPKWDVKYQIMDPKDAPNSGVNVNDLTKTWPRDKFPLQPLGEIELNKNVANYFAEIEQVAFNPAHLIPGIEPSNDPVLQSRLFSYPDAHRHRVGVNYQQLPVNQSHPAYKQANFQRDGAMAFYNQGPRPNYISSIAPPMFKSRSVDVDAVHSDYEGNAVAFLSGVQEEDFVQPRELWRKVFTDQDRKNTIATISGHMQNCSDPEILKRAIAVWHQVDADLAASIAEPLGLKGKYKTDISGEIFNGSHNFLGRNLGQEAGAAKDWNRADKKVKVKEAVYGLATKVGLVNGANGTNGVNGTH
ncbi:catalase-domain-containing protein [Testicularia cyperi]|uniref:Catalase n=1 Tax=Testicularia cyperi TaxID=1882483 RepID=A0A317XTA3_9BASI|nr:catalase-domain-containing protein [Testicularia cyperi]